MPEQKPIINKIFLNKKNTQEIKDLKNKIVKLNLFKQI